MMPDNKIELSFFCDWEDFPDRLLPSAFAEFSDQGAKNLVFTNDWMVRLLREPEFFSTITFAAKGKVAFRDVHAPYGECYDLACMISARRSAMIAEHSQAIAYAAALGARTYTIHIGAYNSVVDKIPNGVLRPLALESLTQLLPVAEKNDVIIAVENAFERSNTPDEVMYYVNYFDHPNIGCCFDCGHANMMRDAKDKTGTYSTYFLQDVWQNEPLFESRAFEKMSPKMATCHLHDNDGASDQHLPPGMGIVDWEKMAAQLLTEAPCLQTIQTEAQIFGCGISISDLVGRFRKIFPSLF